MATLSTTYFPWAILADGGVAAGAAGEAKTVTIPKIPKTATTMLQARNFMRAPPVFAMLVGFTKAAAPRTQESRAD